MSFFWLQILITPFVLFLPLQHLLLPVTDSDYSFCVVFAIVLCPSSDYKLWLLLLCYFCHCIMSFFRLQIMITPFVLFLPSYYVLLPFTHSDYSFCLIFVIAASPSSGYRFWLLLLCYFCHCIMSFFCLQILITPLCYFCYCSISFFRIQIMITPLCYFCHCIMSFFCLQILITPFVLFLPLQHLLLPGTDSDYSFCVIFAITASPSSEYRFWLLLLSYFCHCIMSFFRLQILITPFVIFCHCIMSFFCL